jgi:hypothetical protein
MQSSRRFFVQILVVSAVVLANFIAFTHSASAWPVNNTRALVFSGFAGAELGYQGGQIKIDADDNMIVHGMSAGTVQVNPADPSQIVGNGQESTDYIAKYSTSGELTWVVHWLDNNGDFAIYDIAVTPTGNIVVVGDVYVPNYDVDPSATGVRTIATADTAFMLQLSSSGSLLWVREFNTTMSSTLQSVNVTANGNIVAGGAFEGTLSFDGPGGATIPSFTQVGGVGQHDLFVAMFDSSGVEQWAVTGSSAYGDYVAGIEISSTGDIFIHTGVRGTVTQRFVDGTTGTVTMPSSTNISALIWKLSATGTSQWTATPVTGTGTSEYPDRLAVRRDGTLLLTYFTNNRILSLSNTGAVVTTLESGGDITDIEELSSGRVVLSGAFQGTVDLDPTSGVDSKTSLGPYDDGFVTTLSSTLSYVSTRLYTGDIQQRVNDVISTPDGGWTIAGWSHPTTLSLSTSTETADFGPATGADSMFFIVRYNADESTTVPLTTAPTTVSYLPGNKRATLQWTAPLQATRFVVKNKTGATMCDTKTPSCDLTGLRNGRFSTFMITSYNAAGVASTTTSSVKAMGGFLVKTTSWQVRSKPKLSNIVTTPSKGKKTWRVTSGECRVSGSKLLMPTKKGRCTLTLSVAKKSTYPAMSTTIRVTVTK